MPGDEAADMRFPWTPILLCGVVADVNFWYFASTGENHADYAGIALFLGLAGYFVWRTIVRRSPGQVIPAIGSLAAAAMMLARETGRFDLGYIPPYAVLILFLLVAGVVMRVSRSAPSASQG
jgi:hypothetical protein